MGRFNISTENSYVDGYVEWTQTNLDPVSCTSKLNLKAYLHRKNNSSSSITNRTITRKFFVDGKEYGTTENITITLPSTQEYVLFYEKEVTVTHDIDGSKNNLEIGFQSIYSGTDSFVVPKTTVTINLEAIKRYPKYTLHAINKIEEKSIVIDWSTDSLADYVWYSINGGSYISVGSANSKTGSYTIKNLSPNTTYIIKTKIRQKENGLTGETSEINATTYDVPYAYSLPSFRIGESPKVDVYNPLKRNVKIFICPNNGNWTDVGFTRGSFAILSSILFKDLFLQVIPNSSTNSYLVKCVCDLLNSERITYNGKYTISESPPDFSDFEYFDSNENIAAITENNKYIVKNKSNLRVKISSINKMVVKNYANPSRYEISCGNRTKSLSYSENDTFVDLGTINSPGQMNIIVKAYDSRGFYTEVSKMIVVIDYTGIVQENALYRINNFENDSKLSMKGTFSLLNINNISKNDIVEIKYRYKEINGQYNEYIAVVPNINGNKYECELQNLDLDNSKSFLFEIIVSDKFGSSKIEMILNEGIPILFINKSKKNLGVNCVNKHEEGSVQITGDYYLKSGNKVLDYNKNHESIVEFEDDIKINENNINHNFGILIFNNTSSEGVRWSYATIKSSSHKTYGNKITFENDKLKIVGAKFIRVSAKITFTEESYTYNNDINLEIGNEFLGFINHSSAQDYIIPNLILPITGDTYIRLTKYTNSASDNLITTEQDNYLCVEIIE